MSLLQPTFLFALAAVAVPIILHLVFRRHTKIVRLGSIRFLDELVRETSRRRNLRRWLLLALRAACLVLLALLFARPFVRAAQRSGEDQLVVVLIDQSASMSRRQRGVRLIDAAVEQADRLIATLSENTTIRTGLFNSDVVAINTDETNPARIAAPERLFGRTSYQAALAWARDWCWKTPARQQDVYIFTDLQRAGLDWVDEEPVPADVAVHVVNVADSPANNLAILSVTPSSTIIRPGRDATVRATLFNFGEFDFTDVGVRLTLESDGRQMHFEDTASVPAQQSSEIEFDVSRLQEGRWQGTLDASAEDDLSFDNRRHLAILARPQSRVVILDGSTQDDSDGSGTYFLTRAVGLATPGEAWEESPFRADVIRYRAGEELPSLNDAQIVILADCPPTAADVVRLRRFVEDGGGLLVFTGEETTAATCGPLADSGLTPGAIVGIRRSSDLPLRIQWWEEKHPALEPFSDPQHGDLRQFAYSAYTQIAPSPQTRVLARFGDDDRPALTENRVGKGRVFWLASTASREWNNASRSRLYVPLVHQLLGDCVGLTGGGPVQQLTIDDWRTRPQGADASSEDLRPRVIAQDGRSYVVNVDERESDPEQCEPDELAATATGNPDASSEEAAVAAAGIGPHSTIVSRADEWWPYVVLILAVFLVVETLLANRTPA